MWRLFKFVNLLYLLVSTVLNIVLDILFYLVFIPVAA